jgi:hypothetical protein
MEEGVLWRADVMEGPCAVAREKDIRHQHDTRAFHLGPEVPVLLTPHS